MPAGRPPKPIERQHADARGDGRTAGHRLPRQVVEITPYDPKLVPDIPDDLGHRGTMEWNKIWESGPWLHPQEDFRWVEMIARAYDDMEAFRNQIRFDGPIIAGYTGKIAHPLIREIREAEKVVQKCLSVLGFSPTDRARLGLAELKRQTNLAKLQEKTRG